MSDKIENLRRAVGLVILEDWNRKRVDEAIDAVADEINELQMKIKAAKYALE